jgi:ATP-dependent RNA helicase SUPV3L1/SUV3
MKGLGKDAGLLRVNLEEGDRVTVEGHVIGHLEGFRFVVDPNAGQEDRKLMLAAAERHMPALLAAKAQKLVAEELGELRLGEGAVLRDGRVVARLEAGKTRSRPRLVVAKELGQLEPAHKARLAEALGLWLEGTLAPLAPLRLVEDATHDPEAGSELRALLLNLAAHGGSMPREAAGLAHLPKERRPFLRRLGVNIGSLDVFVPALLKPGPRRLLHALGIDRKPVRESMEAVIEASNQLPAGYRRAGRQAIRLDMAEKLFRAAHEQRAKANRRNFPVDPALATSMGLLPVNFRSLMRDAGFRAGEAKPLPEGAFGPPRPILWSWLPPRKDRPFVAETRPAAPAQPGSAFAGLADLLG